jgi:hypothetical protein
VYNQPYQPGFAQPVQSQYRGLQKTFQPTGYVQSHYNSQQPFIYSTNPQANAGRYSIQSNSFAQQNGFQTQFNPSGYHQSNYVGDRQDHDAALREDSQRPSSYGVGRVNFPINPYVSSQFNPYRQM